MHIYGAVTRFVGLAVVSAGVVLADGMPYSYTTAGTIAGSALNIVFNPQSTTVFGSVNSDGNALGLALGSFTLSKPGALTTINFDNTFTLNVVFTNPIIASATFDALLSGTLRNGTGQSDVDLVFSPSSKVFNFNSPYDGAFLFTVDDILNMNHGAGSPATYNLTGNIRDANVSGTQLSPVPEPSSVFLLLIAIGGIGIEMRRKLSH